MGLLVDENNYITMSMLDLGVDLLSYLGKSFYDGDQYFEGYFDNIRVYNRALSEEEIQIRELSPTGIGGFEIPGQEGKTEMDTVTNTISIAFKGKEIDVTNLIPEIKVIN